MKKGLIVAFFALLGVTQVMSQVSFRPGIRGGLNFSHFTKGDNSNGGYYDNNGNYIPYPLESYDTQTAYNFGFYGALHLSKYYTLQPEIDYSKQGSTYKVSGVSGENKLTISYLSIAVVNKFTFNNFNIHLGPTIEFVVDKNFDSDSDFDLAFLLGAGYNFTNQFGIEARIKKGIVPVLDYSYSNHTNVVFQLGATYTFDLK